MIEMTIDSIRVSMMNYQRVVILKEKDAERFSLSGSVRRRPMRLLSSYRASHRRGP